jgi:hypothetical protein
MAAETDAGADAMLTEVGARMTEAFRTAVAASGATNEHAALALAVASHLTRHLSRHVDAICAVDIEGADGAVLRADVAIVEAGVPGPRQRRRGARVVPAAGVRGVVEVRPLLERDALRDALRTVASFKRMRGAPAYGVVLGHARGGLAALHDDVDEGAQGTAPSERADLVCALDDGVLVDSTDFSAVTTCEPLLMMTLFLQHAFLEVAGASRPTAARNTVALTRSLDLRV